MLYKLNFIKHKVFLLAVIAFFWLIGLAHIILGASLASTFLAALTMNVATFPLMIFSLFDIPSLLLFLTALRYVGIAMIAKLFFAQTLDSNLDFPFESFLAVLIGIISYALAVLIVRNVDTKTIILYRLELNDKLVRILSYLALLLGFASNFVSALRGDGVIEISSIFNFFRDFLSLSMILSVYLSLKESHGKKALNLLSIITLVIGFLFAFASNKRAFLRNIFLGWIATEFAFKGRLSWRVFVPLFITTFLIFQVLTPLILFTRLDRGNTTWTDRVQISINAFSNWRVVQEVYKNRFELSQRSPHLGYFGSYQNVLERLSFIDHVDAVVNGVTNTNRTLGFADIEMAITRSLPRFILPNKPPDNFGHGDWILCELNIHCNLGGFNTLQLIPCAFAAWGWLGVALYPLIFGLLFFVAVKFISGLNLYRNPWGIFILIIGNNTFSEGSTMGNIVFIIRFLPQYLVLIFLLYFSSLFIYKYFYSAGNKFSVNSLD